jgi:nucleoside-diphosphate-sugar epimerase
MRCAPSFVVTLYGEIIMRSRSRTVLLTGAAGHIGRVMTRALLDDGLSVAAVDRDAASRDVSRRGRAPLSNRR